MVDIIQVMAVNLNRMPAKRAGPVGVGLNVPSQLGLASLSQTIDVDDGSHVGEVVVGGLVETFPYGALRGFAVSHQHPHTIRKLVEILAGQRDADSNGQALTKRARGHIDIRNNGYGMTLDRAAELYAA